MDYNDFVSALSVEAEIDSSDVNFIAILPTVINDAEMRCYKDLDLLVTYVTDTSSNVTANNRLFSLPAASGKFIAVTEFWTFTPVGSYDTFAAAAPASVAMINYLWPSDASPSATTTPAMWARLDDDTLLLGPTPGDNFAAMVRGTIRPTPLSAANLTSWLTLYAYDLFFAAAMARMSGYMRNWSAQADDPKMALSWEAKYQSALAGAAREELRKKFAYRPGGQ